MQRSFSGGQAVGVACLVVVLVIRMLLRERRAYLAENRYRYMDGFFRGMQADGLPLLLVVVLGAGAILLRILSFVRREGRGGWWAAGAILIGILGFAFVGDLVADNIERRGRFRLLMCGANLHAIGCSVQLYMAVHDDSIPPDLETLIQAGYLTRDGLRRPSGRTRREQSDYFYLAPADDAPNEALIACDFEDNHDRLRHAVRFGSSAPAFTEEQFQAELREPHNTAFAKALRQAEGGR